MLGEQPGPAGIGASTPVLIDNKPELPGFDYRRTNFNKDRPLSFNTICPFLGCNALITVLG